MDNLLLVVAYKTYNYGTVLQAVATQEILKQLDNRVEILNLEVLNSSIKKRKIIFFLFKDNVINIIKSKGGLVKKKLHKIVNKKFKKNDDARKKLFLSFIEHNLNLSIEYSSWEMLSRCINNYSVCMVGSDQLWLPSSVVGDVYTLSFANSRKIKKISYATSFGISSIPTKYHKYYKKMFEDIPYISVREQSGRQIVQSISERDVPVVLDPVYLLSEQQWDKLIEEDKKPIEKGYIFCYFLGTNMEARDTAVRLKNLTSKRLMFIGHMENYVSYDDKIADEIPFDVSPIHFINLLKNADYVLTDSFHAASFSLIFHKNFWLFSRHKNMKMSTNNRLKALVETKGIPERYIENGVVYDKLDAQINYDNIDKILEEERKVSLRFLKEALGKGKNDL